MRCREFSTLTNMIGALTVVCAFLFSAIVLTGCSIKPQPSADQENSPQKLKEGQPEAAKALLKRAIDAAERSGQPEQTADAYRDLAILSINSDSRDRQAMAYAERALELAEQKYGLEGDARLLPFLIAAGKVTYRLHDFNRAEKIFARALALHDQLQMPDDMQFGEVLGGLISASCAGGQCLNAEPLYKRLIAVRTSKLGADHADTLSAKMMYAENCEQRLRYTQARDIYMDCITRAQKSSPQLLPILLTAIGRLYNREQRYTEAEQALKGAERLAQSNRNFSGRYQIWRELALTCEKQKRFADAAVAFKRAIASAASLTGVDSPEMVDLQAAYAAFRKRTGS